MEKTPEERHQAMSWMQRLKRVFNIEIETCQRCCGRVKVIACIEDPLVIEKILTHLKKQEAHALGTKPQVSLHQERAPPQSSLFK